MKKITFSFFVIAISLIIFVGLSSSKKIDNKSTAVVSNSVIVLELFTSQGCSSCPSADELVGAYRNDSSIITLAYHVDYWNRLGWVDTFSTASFSERQRNYANQFNEVGVYTPQLVVNGATQFVGSNKTKLTTTIEQSFTNTNNTGISISDVTYTKDKVLVNFSTTSTEKKIFYSVALVQNEAVTKIKHGENRGVQLTNYSIVRDLVTVSTINAAKEKLASLKLPKGFQTKNYAIVILEQGEDMKIRSAVKKVL